MLSTEFAIKNYIESWGQTFGTPDFDTLANGSEGDPQLNVEGATKIVAGSGGAKTETTTRNQKREDIKIERATRPLKSLSG